MKLWWSLLMASVALPMIISAKSAESDFWEEGDKEVLVRTVRGAKAGSNNNNSPACRYNKSQWSECDPKTNERTRTLTFKKGDKTCQQTKTITKKCKKGKACRYEKGTWSSCTNNVMVRIDTLKTNSDSTTCEKTRSHTKNCKSETNTKKNGKDRSNKKSGKQQ